jgi:hypothetical protein
MLKKNNKFPRVAEEIIPSCQAPLFVHGVRILGKQQPAGSVLYMVRGLTHSEV